MLEEYFQEVGLTLVELPIEFSDDLLIYRGYIKAFVTGGLLCAAVQILMDKTNTVYVQSIYRILRIGKCDTEHEQSRISVRQCTDGALFQYLEE